MTKQDIILRTVILELLQEAHDHPQRPFPPPIHCWR